METGLEPTEEYTMRHLKRVSKLPQPAQNGDPSGTICDNLGSDTQAKFCFVSTFLETFLLPVIQLKDNTQDPAS